MSSPSPPTHMDSDSPHSRSSSPEDSVALPEYAQNILPEVELPTLVLVSHGSSPPLNPAPHLRFDCRSLPNPPKHIRDAHNGTSKRVQEWMQNDERFVTRHDEIKTEIEAAMTTVTAKYEKEDVLESGPQHDEEPSEPGSPSVAVCEEVETESRNDAASGNGEKDASSSRRESFQEVATGSRDQTATIRVGIFCAMGRHRSVAMVEELAKLAWPGWRVEVQHRDISRKRGAGKKSGGKGSRGSRGGTVAAWFDDQSG